MIYLSAFELDVLRVLSDGTPRRPAQIARELGEPSSGYTGNTLQTLKAPGMALVRSEYIRTGDPNDWGLWSITGKGEAEVYTRQTPQLKLGESLL